MTVQKHLTYNEMTNLGCFYTPQNFVKILKQIILKNIDIKNYVFLDSSCGYGSILKGFEEFKTVGGDIDSKAIKTAKTYLKNTNFFCLNSLQNCNRKHFNISYDDKVIIVSNPPYNDVTSKVKNEIKQNNLYKIDEDLKTRDFGISFLLSFNKLKADYVGVFHPLSYMIKKANYNLAKKFFENYKLLDCLVLNSQEFSLTSKASGFPIILALYKRDKGGISFEEIRNYKFKTYEGKVFCPKIDSISNYLKKYPKNNMFPKDDDVLFWTMRDINALKRSKTFIQDYSTNSIIIDKNQFAYYCYVDVFKEFIKNMPYYFGNLDVFIDNSEFLKIKEYFVARSVEKYYFLKPFAVDIKKCNYEIIAKYFKNLLGEHYV